MSTNFAARVGERRSGPACLLHYDYDSGQAAGLGARVDEPAAPTDDGQVPLQRRAAPRDYPGTNDNNNNII